MVTGSPRMISKSSTKSARCIGSSRSSAALPLGVGVGEDHLAHHRDALGVEEHVLGAAEPEAVDAEVARHARLGRACRRWRARPRSRAASAQSSSSEKAPPSSGGIIAGAPASTSPRVPSRVISAPSRKMRPSGAGQRAGRRGRGAGRRRRRRRAGRGRGRSPRRGWSCRRASVSTPRAACMPRMSSGLVSRRTRIVASSCAAAACAASAVKTMRPVAAPGLAARPVPKTSRGAAGSICGCRCSIRLRGSMRSSASSRVIDAGVGEIDRDADRGAGVAARPAARRGRDLGRPRCANSSWQASPSPRSRARRRPRARRAPRADLLERRAAPAPRGGRVSSRRRRGRPAAGPACAAEAAASARRAGAASTGCMCPSRWRRGRGRAPAPARRARGRASAGAPLAWRRMRAEGAFQARAIARAAASSCVGGILGQALAGLLLEKAPGISRAARAAPARRGRGAPQVAAGDRLEVVGVEAVHRLAEGRRCRAM